MDALVVFAAAMALAAWESWPKADERRLWRTEALISVIMGLGALAISIALKPLGHAEETTAAMAVFLLVFIADDFLYYWAHRAAHRVSLFWASHAVHHSPVRFNLFTGLRQPLTWLTTPAAAAPVALLLIGAPPAAIALSSLVRAVWHFALHTEHVRRLPNWLELVFNTPSHHRVHHASAGVAMDRNFSGVLIVWDRLFGTFAAEPREGIRAYGLQGAAQHASLKAVLLLPYTILARRWRQRRTLLRALFAPPETI